MELSQLERAKEIEKNIDEINKNVDEIDRALTWAKDGYMDKLVSVSVHNKNGGAVRIWMEKTDLTNGLNLISMKMKGEVEKLEKEFQQL